MATEAFVPKFLDSSLELERQLFLEGLNESLPQESFHQPLDSSLLDQLGRAVQPLPMTKKAINGLVFIITDALKNDKLRDSPYPFNVTRFYLAGDYCGTAVASYRDTQLIVYIDRPERTDISNIAQFCCAKIHHHFANRPELRLNPDPSMEITVKNSCIVVKSEPFAITIKFCDEAFSARDGSIAAKTELVLKTMDDEARIPELRTALLEPYARIVSSLPQQWTGFIRFCKYWVIICCGSKFPMDAVESLAFKLLLRHNPAISDDLLDTKSLFAEFLVCLSDDKELAKLDDIKPSYKIFCRPAVEQCSARFKEYGPQPEIHVDWESLPKLSHSIRPVVTGLFDRTVDHLDCVSDVMWLWTQHVAKLTIPQMKNGTLNHVFAFAFLHGKSKPERSTLMKMYIAFIRGSLLGLVVAVSAIFAFFFTYLESPNGTLPKHEFQMWHSKAETKFVDMTGYLLSQNLQWVVDSSAFSAIEDFVGVAIDIMVEVPDIWERRVSEHMRHQLAITRDTWQSHLSLSHYLDLLEDEHNENDDHAVEQIEKAGSHGGIYEDMNNEPVEEHHDIHYGGVYEDMNNEPVEEHHDIHYGGVYEDIVVEPIEDRHKRAHHEAVSEDAGNEQVEGYESYDRYTDNASEIYSN